MTLRQPWIVCCILNSVDSTGLSYHFSWIPKNWSKTGQSTNQPHINRGARTEQRTHLADSIEVNAVFLQLHSFLNKSSLCLVSWQTRICRVFVYYQLSMLSHSFHQSVTLRSQFKFQFNSIQYNFTSLPPRLSRDSKDKLWPPQGIQWIVTSHNK